MDPRDLHEQLRPQIKGHGAGWFVVGTPQVPLPPGRMQGAGGGPAGGAQQSTTAAMDPAWSRTRAVGRCYRNSGNLIVVACGCLSFFFLGFSLPSLGQNT